MKKKLVLAAAVIFSINAFASDLDVKMTVSPGSKIPAIANSKSISLDPSINGQAILVLQVCTGVSSGQGSEHKNEQRGVWVRNYISCQSKDSSHLNNFKLNNTKTQWVCSNEKANVTDTAGLMPDPNCNHPINSQSSSGGATNKN